MAQGNIVGTNVYSGASVVGTTTAAAVFDSVDGNGAGVAADNGGLFETIALNANAANPNKATNKAAQTTWILAPQWSPNNREAIARISR